MMFIARAITALSARRHAAAEKPRRSHVAPQPLLQLDPIVLPPVQALFLRHAHSPLPQRLVDVGEHVRVPPEAMHAVSRATDAIGVATVAEFVPPRQSKPATSAARYTVRTLHPSNALLSLAADGARFDLSRVGALRVWHAQTLVAAQSHDDCSAPTCRRLHPKEIEYLAAYLRLMGRRWNDPDQLGT